MSLIALAFMMLAGVMSPGPASAAILALGFAGRARDGVACAAGITIVNLGYATAVLSGLAVLTRIDPAVRALAAAAGGCLLLWIGAKLFRGGRRAVRDAGHRASSSGKAASVPEVEKTASSGLFRSVALGMAVQASNLNAMVFFASVFAAATPPGAGLATKAAILLIVAAISFGWYGGLGALSGRLAARGGLGGPWAGRLRQAGGLAVIAFGGWLIWRALSPLLG